MKAMNCHSPRELDSKIIGKGPLDSHVNFRKPNKSAYKSFQITLLAMGGILLWLTKSPILPKLLETPAGK